jgi:hypothetical protein
MGQTGHLTRALAGHLHGLVLLVRGGQLSVKTRPDPMTAAPNETSRDFSVTRIRALEWQNQLPLTSISGH